MAPQRNAGAGAEAELPEYAGHYRLESCLGSGGMGVVHLARSTSGMKLAVKVIHAEFARDREFRGRFRQEIAAARRVSGAFTASVVDADPEAERPWMATLFIPGPTLSDHVKRNGSMAPEQLRRLMAGLAEALRDIHRVGVVHRDLKPSNVLLAEDGPKVIDFGISRPKDSELRTETGKLIGTPPFMAPEQFRRPREVGPAADIFALGSVMVHAATGRGPFDSDSPYVVAYQVVHDEPDLTGVPDNLAPLIQRCLAKDPEDRPTPDELMRSLRSVAASYDTQAFIPSQRTTDEYRAIPRRAERPAERPPKRWRSRRAAALAGGVLALVVGGGIGTYHLVGGDDPAPTRNSARTTPAGFEAWETESVSGAAATPQCSYGAGKLLCAQPGVVFALKASDGALLWRHATAKTHRSKPPVLSGGVVQPLTERDPRLEGLDPASGKARWERTTPPYSGMCSAGGMVLFTDADGAVTGVDGMSGETKWSHRIPGQGVPFFSSFAGDGLAYATSQPDESTTAVTAVDPATGSVQWKARLPGTLKPVGAQDGSVFFLSSEPFQGTTAVVRYTPGSRTPQRVALPVTRQDPLAAVRGSVVYVLSTGGALEAVDMAAGKRLWSLETSLSRGSAPVVDGRHVYISGADGRLLAVDTRSGTLVGQTSPRLAAKADRVVGELPAPILAHHHVYAAAPNGSVFAVDARDPASW
ncbi:serine/threonine-protein kinase [Streptomyces sp. TRM68416]|uniref:serine/threonine-protein kinase n=1 Tax=Streptomyces sp. TRM68416 TaxID=2758412 RepID=UPI0016619128|nr:serine/threonine-protein kinase [Streptomyces sp. TRM68416]MBD0838970.1 PQQ-binding-like beta-propeller repeat protein [Streptomyces sp. TRM68416]